MGAISIILALLMPAIAPIIGYYLGKSTKEELAKGKKYFIAMQNVLFTAIIAVFLYAGKWNLYVMIPGLAVLFAYLAFKQFRNSFIAQALFGIIFSLSILTNYFFVISALIFVYGLPTGSLFVKQKKGLLKSVIAGLLFAIIAYASGYFL